MTADAPGTIRFCPRCGSDRLERRIPERDDRERTVCTACGYVHYVGPVVAAGLLVHDGDGRLCLVRRALSPGKGRWTFPGGFVDLGESPEQAACREALEEAGCEAEVEGIVGAYPSEGPRGKQVVVLVYAARARRSVAVHSREVLEVRWFGLDELPRDEFAFASTATALRDWLAARR